MTIAVQRFPKPSRTLQAHSPANTSASASPIGADDMGMPLPTQSGAKPRSGSRKPPKAKTCRVCKSTFQPTRAVQPTCTNFECRLEYGLQAVAKAKAARARKEARAHREAKEKAKPLRAWLDDAQTIVNKYVRLRDAHLPCISCGTTSDVQFAAGHYRARGSASHLRFNHDNLNKQCNRHCNMALSGNQRNYRIGLIAKIGIERVEALENDNTQHKWTVEEAKAVISQHKLLVKELEKA